MIKGGHFTLLKVDWSPEIIGCQARNSLEKTTWFWPIQHLQNPKIPKKPSEIQRFCVKIVIFNLFNMFSELRPCRGFSGGGRVTEKPGVAGPTKLYLSCAHTYSVLDHTLRNNRGNKDTLNTLNLTGPMTGLGSDEIYVEHGHRGGIHRVRWGGTANFVNSTPSTGGSRWK